MKIRNITALLGALFLAGCGGGGDNPGTCNGSAQWCAETGGKGSGTGAAPAPAPVTSPTFIAVSDALLYTTTCLEILALNGQNEVAARAAANDAYKRGNFDLDGPPKNGVPCDYYFP